MKTHDVTDSNFEKEVLESDKTVLVDFWAEWCGPCKMLSPVLEEVASSMGNEVKIVKVDVDKNPEAPSKYGVRGIPTLMIFKGGALVDTKTGVLEKSGLEAWIRST